MAEPNAPVSLDRPMADLFEHPDDVVSSSAEISVPYESDDSDIGDEPGIPQPVKAQGFIKRWAVKIVSWLKKLVRF